MSSVIEPAERAVLEEKIRTVFGAGAATTALLKIIDAVNSPAEPQTALDIVVEEPAPEVQVVESSP